MSLAPGSRLGAYEIISLLGAGGMGEVYRAHDTKLNRRVAIKVLPDAYARDHERVARFHREAQAVAALNHPNIAAIFDLAEAASLDVHGHPVTFLVLELIEGDTLADLLKRGALPIDQACQIAVQILEALEAAHEKGICHRDLKPANIKLAPDGAVKVLDFGLAKFLTTGPSASNLSHSPTLTLGATVPGVILGTAAYMSPEQAKGFDADQRSDIFSFACIFYEMLSGRPAFEGETVSDILAGVLKTDVDFARLPSRLNPRLIEVLRRCFEKSAKKRWHSAADVRVEIESAIALGATVTDVPAAETRSRSRQKQAIALIAGVMLGGMAAAYAAWTLKPSPPRTIARFAVPLPEGQQFSNTGRNVVALSPDGTNLVFVANQRLYLRPMGSVEARVIAGTESFGAVVNPVFSPNGDEIVFHALLERALRRIPVGGGVSTVVCAAENPLGVSWGEYGIVFGQAGKGILRVAPAGGTPEVIAQVGAEEFLSTPQFLPGGRTLLYSVRTVNETWDKGRVVAQALGGERKVLVEGGAAGQYVSSGHLLYAVSGRLFAVSFDPQTLSVSGTPVAVIEGLRRSAPGGIGSTGVAHVSVSAAGTLAYVPGPATTGDPGTDLAFFDRKGGVEPLKLPVGPYSSPRASPDGKFVAFERSAENESSVWVYELSSGRSAQQLTFGGNNRWPVWSPDSRTIAFQSDREGDRAIFVQRADGSGVAERLTKPENGEMHVAQSWSRDDHLLFTVESKQPTLWTLNMKDRKHAPLGGVRSREGAFSPDGRWVAYQVLTEKGHVVYVEPFPRTGAKYLVPQSGGHPYWSPNGDEIWLNTGPGQSAVVGVSTTPRVTFSRPVIIERLNRSEANPTTSRRNADMMPDGRILGVPNQFGDDTDPERHIVVVMNWFDELRARVPISSP